MVAKVVIKEYEKLRLELIRNAWQMHTSYAFQSPVLNAMTLNELYDYPIFGGDFISLSGSVGSQRPGDDLV